MVITIFKTKLQAAVFIKINLDLTNKNKKAFGVSQMPIT
jgi:hypothetical protein